MLIDERLPEHDHDDSAHHESSNPLSHVQQDLSSHFKALAFAVLLTGCAAPNLPPPSTPGQEQLFKEQIAQLEKKLSACREQSEIPDGEYVLESLGSAGNFKVTPDGITIQLPKVQGDHEVQYFIPNPLILDPELISVEGGGKGKGEDKGTIRIVPMGETWAVMFKPPATDRSSLVISIGRSEKKKTRYAIVARRKQ